MAGRFIGKVALVTGAGSGIGRASAKRFALDGARVVVADIEAKTGEETVQLIRDARGEATFVHVDVSKADQVEALVAAVVTIYGQLDYAHNNAGIEGESARIADSSEENFDRVIAINQRGVWLCLKYEIRQLLQQESGGAIVNTASIAGLVAVPGISPYVASKHAIVGMTKAAALEYGQSGIRVNAVCPGAVDTPMISRLTANPQIMAQVTQGTPAKRLGQVEEIANTVAWLCSSESSFINGVALPVDGGFVAQ